MLRPRHHYRRPLTEALETRTFLDAELAVDLNPATFGSAPSGFVTLGDSTYFFAGGSTLWKTDGTPQGTVAVRDGFRGAQNVTVAGGRIYFAAVTEADQDLAYPDALWSSDGTAAGTVLLRRFEGLYGPVSLNGFTEYGGRVYFRAAARGEHFRIWSTDNTPEGTTPFTDPAAEPGKAAGWPVVSGGLLYFTYFEGSGGGSSSLWRSDGTAAGTIELREFPAPTNNFWSAHQLTDVNGTLFFVAPTRPGGTDGELWKSDGTPQGTVLVKDVYPGDDFTGPVNLINAGGTLYFPADDSPTSGRALWKSDGTEAGTVKVPVATDPVITGTRPTALGDVVVFSGLRPDNSRGLWRSDGTAAGTYLLRNLNAGRYSEEGFPRVVVGDELYFAADDGVHGRELWKTDGTVAGTAMVEDINPGPGSGGPTGGAALGNKLVFAARGAWVDATGSSDDSEPWVSDGTAAGTFRLKDINTTPQGTSFAGRFIPVGEGVLFGAGGALHFSEGTPQGTRRLLARLYLPQEIPNVGLGWARISDERVVFAASESPSLQSLALYASDGTAEGTMRLADLGAMTPMPVVDGFAYFVGNHPATGVELWKTDGTPAGTSIVRNIVPGAAGIMPYSGAQRFPGQHAIAAVGDLVYFHSGRDEVWRTDGTEAGTVLVRDMGLPSSGQVDRFGSAGGKLFFETSQAGGSPALWVSDGTGPGSRLIMDVDVRSNIVEAGGRAFFLGTPPGTDSKVLFVSDGTAGRSVAVRDFGTLPVLGGPLTVFRGEVYLGMSDGLWKSDGTPAGTVRVGHWQGGPSGQPLSLVVRPDALYFVVHDGQHGRELWKTDGTAAGTVLVEDIFPGAVGSDPASLAVAADGTLFFAATDPAHARELWKVDAVTPQVYVRGRDWTPAFLAYLQRKGLGDDVYGYRLDDKPASDVLPWVNSDEIVVRLPRDFADAAFTVTLDGDRPGSDQSPNDTRRLDSRTSAVPLARPLGTLSGGDNNGVRYALAVSGLAVPFNHRFNVLQGDADRSGTVLANDFSDVKRKFFRTAADPGPAGPTRYSAFHDVNGDGSILANDFSAVKARFFDALLPVAAAAGTMRSGNLSATRSLFVGAPPL